MNPIIDYDVVATGDFASLVMQVREFIRKGWEPQGGMCYSNMGGGLYLQTIVKREKPITDVYEIQAAMLERAFR